MSGVEGVEREDYDDGEAGVGLPAAGFRLPVERKASTTKGTKVHEGKRTGGAFLTLCVFFVFGIAGLTPV